jgi:cyclase
VLLKRYIPCLLLKNSGLVKTTKFKDPKYIGDPINTVRIFNEKEVDELIFLDIEATPQKHEPNYKLLCEIADECFMPLAYGGGITNLDQAKKIFQIGIEKVAINSEAHTNLKLISEIAGIYGSQAIIGVIDVKKNFFGKQEIVSHSATVKHKFTPEEWARELVKAGVGEIMITSVDKEGTWEGLDVNLIKKITDAVNVPVIAHGGAGNIEHLKMAIHQGGASAIAMGSMVVYQKKDFGVLVNFPDKKILESL